SRTICRAPPIIRRVDDLGTRQWIPCAHRVSDDVVLVGLVGGDRARGLSGTEGNACPRVHKAVPGEAVQCDRVVLRAPGRIRRVAETGECEAVPAIVGETVPLDRRVLRAALQAIEEVVAER